MMGELVLEGGNLYHVWGTTPSQTGKSVVLDDLILHEQATMAIGDVFMTDKPATNEQLHSSLMD